MEKQIKDLEKKLSCSGTVKRIRQAIESLSTEYRSDYVFCGYSVMWYRNELCITQSFISEKENSDYFTSIDEVIVSALQYAETEKRTHIIIADHMRGLDGVSVGVDF